MSTLAQRFRTTAGKLHQALRGRGSLEDKLVLLGVIAGGLFAVLVLTLFLVQNSLGKAQRSLVGQALPAEELIARLESSIGATFRRQAQVSTTVSLAQLEPLRERRRQQNRASMAFLVDELRTGGLTAADAEILAAVLLDGLVGIVSLWRAKRITRPVAIDRFVAIALGAAAALHTC